MFYIHELHDYIILVCDLSLASELSLFELGLHHHARNRDAYPPLGAIRHLLQT